MPMRIGNSLKLPIAHDYMKLSKLQLTNFRGFQSLEVDLHPKVTLFVGINGVGKSTILDSVAISLSKLVSMIVKNGTGKQIKTTDIGVLASECLIHISSNDLEIQWEATKSKNKSIKKSGRYSEQFINLVHYFQYQISENNGNINIPLFVHFSTNRAVLDVPLRIRKKHEFNLLEAYEGSLQSGVNFRSFFEWYRNREDLENEIKISQLADTSNKDIFLKSDPQIDAVRRAIKGFMSDFQNLRVRRNPLRMTVDKLGKTLEINQLSDGEKCMLAMVGDIARRLAIANPLRENPLEGEGVVLIDEIELHLHPKWQREIVGKLVEVFPNCQFILSTHSPQAIGELPHDCIRILFRNKEGKMDYFTPNQSLGLSSNEILEELMGTSGISNEMASRNQELFSLIDQEKWKDAEDLLSILQKETNGSTSELVRAESLISMLKEG